jgi:hypothetical protein
MYFLSVRSDELNVVRYSSGLAEGLNSQKERDC